jgi:Flp pilus assembly protein TadD
MRLIALLLAGLALFASPARAQQSAVIFANESNASVTLITMDKIVCQLNRAGDASGTSCTVSIAIGDNTITAVRGDGRAFSAMTFGMGQARVRVTNDRFIRGDGVRFSTTRTESLGALCASNTAPAGVRLRGCDDLIKDTTATTRARSDALVMRAGAQPDDAKRLADLGEAIRVEPANSNAHYSRCVAQAQRRAFDLAIADCNEALRLKPGDAEYLRYRALSHLGRGDNAAALKDFDATLKLQKSAFAEYGRGITLTRLGRKSSARKSLAKGAEVAALFETTFGLKP